MPPRIQETPSEDEADDLEQEEEEEEEDEEEAYSDEDQLESDPPESSPQTSRAPTKAPAGRRNASRKSAATSKQQTSSELSSIMGGDDATSQADELASEEGDDAEYSTATKKRPAVKLKLKLGDSQQSPVNPALERTRNQGRRSSTASSGASSTRPRGKKRAREEEEDTDPDDWSDTGDSETVDLSRLTARQRAKETGETIEPVNLLELPSNAKKGKYDGLTEAEIALKKSENTRRRQSQLAKRLEDEKQETVNKLLKKQARGKGKKGKKIVEEEEAEEGVVKAPVAPVAVAPAPPPSGYRHISSIRSGEFGYVLAVPVGSEDLYKPVGPLKYPGPRPPPPTRRLVAAS